MKQRLEKIIEDISSFDLSTYPIREVDESIKQMGKFGCVIVTLHPNKMITRARPNYGNDIFQSRSQVSYKPAENNNSYQRASTPNMTMFYGAIIPEKQAAGELTDPRIPLIYETLPWMRKKTTKRIQKMTFSNWIVTQDIQLVAIVQHKDFYEKGAYLKELADAFNGFIKNHPEELETTLLITEFFAKEFAKDVEENQNHDYLLSAAFTEVVVKMGFDGVLYPSMRIAGKGLNIAITPDATDRSLKLVSGAECTIYKNLDKTTVDNERIIDKIDNEDGFVYQPVEAHYHAGLENCLREVGAKSTEELMNE
ncbi:MAG: RES domain-containing protein [Microcystis aeruginosa Ma_QC_Ca_00000000_S207]|uniref:RES domain-containing protein n=1 Tax=Microcystis aeruginosa Ma_QC_Ca_00000000_S207 TaxID=2486251 RepID=A0A552FHS9_MICAE|nr:MAG: RES domain-containing protein [Microcystis aeruginosa Ma_QC_Ca_00000000_S207]